MLSSSKAEAEAYIPSYQLLQSTELVWNKLSNGNTFCGFFNDIFTSVIFVSVIPSTVLYN